jgi:hypothetical protein
VWKLKPTDPSSDLNWPVPEGREIVVKKWLEMKDEVSFVEASGETHGKLM